MSLYILVAFALVVVKEKKMSQLGIDNLSNTQYKPPEGEYAIDQEQIAEETEKTRQTRTIGCRFIAGKALQKTKEVFFSFFVDQQKPKEKTD